MIDQIRPGSEEKLHSATSRLQQAASQLLDVHYTSMGVTRRPPGGGPGVELQSLGPDLMWSSEGLIGDGQFLQCCHLREAGYGSARTTLRT